MSVFLSVLKRERQERGSESVLLGHVPAEMQPSPVSVEGDSDDEGSLGAIYMGLELFYIYCLSTSA